MIKKLDGRSLSLYIQSVTEKCEQILGMSSTYQNKKNIRINMYPEIFN
jgi:hypothetical protein